MNATTQTVGGLKTQEYLKKWGKPISKIKLMDIEHYEELAIRFNKPFNYTKCIELARESDGAIINFTYNDFIKPLYKKACKVLDPLVDITVHAARVGDSRLYSHKQIIKNELKLVFENEYFITDEDVLEYYKIMDRNKRREQISKWRKIYG